MRRTTFSITVALALFAASFGCAGRSTEDRVDSGSHGPTSPADSGQHGASAMGRPEGPNKASTDQEHQTAGLTGEMSNGKVDATMEGSGNLAWQGNYEREKRARQQSESPTQQKPQPR